MPKKASDSVIDVVSVDKTVKPPKMPTKALALPPETTKEVSLVVATAQAAKIIDADSYAEVISLRSRIKAVAKSIETSKKSITDPLNSALKAARDFFRKPEADLEQAESILNREILGWDTACKRKLEEDRAKLLAREAAGRLKPETVERKLGELAPVRTTTSGAAGGSVTIRKTKVAVVFDESLVPATYREINMVLLRRDALAGIQIPGVRVEEQSGVSGS